MRKDILETCKEILKLLDHQKNLSINQIAHKIKCQWRTTSKALSFLEDIGVVVQKEGRKSYMTERLFSKSFNRVVS